MGEDLRAAALEALVFARSQGVAVDGGPVAKASAFMAQALANPSRFKWCSSDALCKARLRFEALTRSGFCSNSSPVTYPCPLKTALPE